jgi:hypothetical protein
MPTEGFGSEISRITNLIIAKQMAGRIFGEKVAVAIVVAGKEFLRSVDTYEDRQTDR